MDAKGRLGVRNWDFSGQHASAEQVVQPVSDTTLSQAAASQNQPAFLKVSAYQDRSSTMTESSAQMSTMDYNTWITHRNFLSATKSTLGPMRSNQINLEMTNSMPNLQPSAENAQSNEQFESKPSKAGRKHSSGKRSKQGSAKNLRQNQPKKTTSEPKKRKSGSISIGIREKRNLDLVAEGVTFDFSGVPAPVCSCTGVARQCYRWGAGGWQSSCCTTTISEYPLPMSTSRPGSRLAGRKMSNGAYGKLLQRLAIEGHDLSTAVDLKNHWARHGTNKFVTIR